MLFKNSIKFKPYKITKRITYYHNDNDVTLNILA